MAFPWLSHMAFPWVFHGFPCGTGGSQASHPARRSPWGAQRGALTGAGRWLGGVPGGGDRTVGRWRCGVFHGQFTWERSMGKNVGYIRVYNMPYISYQWILWWYENHIQYGISKKEIRVYDISMEEKLSSTNVYNIPLKYPIDNMKYLPFTWWRSWENPWDHWDIMGLYDDYPMGESWENIVCNIAPWSL